ncbi:MAG: PaaI family thioesterase [bacterium]|jgi:acyl-coenzyme A thioesterase PaaI-like protein
MPTQRTAFIDDDFCFACGQKNPLGLALSFDVREDGTCATEFTAAAHHQGFAGILHGGLIATIADDLMNNHLFRGFGVYTATAELSTRFKAPAPLGEPLVFTSRRTAARGKVHEMECDVRKKSDGSLLAVCKGRFIEVSVPSAKIL